MAILDTVKKFGLRIKTATGYITYKLGSEFVQMDNGKDLQTAFDDLNDELNSKISDLYSFKRVNNDTYGYRTPNTIVLIGTRVVMGSSSIDYRLLLTAADIISMLNVFDPSISYFNAMQRCYISTCNADADTANVRFYEPEWWQSLEAYYQYYYPASSASIRINFRLEYILPS